MEMFKVRMQGQYGGKDDKRLRVVVSDMWKQYGFRKGIMRGYWVRVSLSFSSPQFIPAFLPPSPYIPFPGLPTD